MQIQEYMKTDVKTCTKDESVVTAAKKMAENNIGSLIVVEADQPIGIFTERDLVNRVVALGKDPNKVHIGEVMTCDLVTVAAEDRIGAVYHILIERNVRHIPVVQAGKLVGIMSQKDIAKVMDEQFYGMYYGKQDLSGAYRT